MTAVLTLSEKLDFSAVARLKSELLALSGQDVEVDATCVNHMGTLCLQVLLAASKDWGAAGKKFDVISASDICSTQLALHGFSPETLSGK